MNKDRLLAKHIRGCIEAIQEYVEPGQEVLWRDRKTQKAILRELHELSESAQRLSGELKLRYPRVPWDEIGDFRNVVVHNYMGINLNRIWNIISKELEPLRQMAESESSGSDS